MIRSIATELASQEEKAGSLLHTILREASLRLIKIGLCQQAGQSIQSRLYLSSVGLWSPGRAASGSSPLGIAYYFLTIRVRVLSVRLRCILVHRRLSDGAPPRRRRNMHRHSTELGFGNLPRERGILCDVWSPADAFCMLQLRQSPRMSTWALCTGCHRRAWSVRWDRQKGRGEWGGQWNYCGGGGELNGGALFQPGSPDPQITGGNSRVSSARKLGPSMYTMYIEIAQADAVPESQLPANLRGPPSSDFTAPRVVELTRRLAEKRKTREDERVGRLIFDCGHFTSMGKKSVCVTHNAGAVIRGRYSNGQAK
ncbi:hypothetical protein KC323_g109 [Hortaea werneckii]|nr:hypothetical protein KC323_g109 [Hortaea werneckii]